MDEFLCSFVSFVVKEKAERLKQKENFSWFIFFVPFILVSVAKVGSSKCFTNYDTKAKKTKLPCNN
ncbi:hypothetical protein DHW03_16375 [Pedobacter yonginense]|uniref:Uncharacterized protein n=1 Tax=Pedobacter yonginense TaxID=651869 RepID=A0A317EM39_9SPHI|nr:hypothetical protein DHW03_16375 [Pedobacter yonginense]